MLAFNGDVECITWSDGDEVAGEVEVSRTVGLGVGPMEGERQTRKGKGCTAESSIFLHAA